MLDNERYFIYLIQDHTIRGEWKFKAGKTYTIHHLPVYVAMGFKKTSYKQVVEEKQVELGLLDDSHSIVYLEKGISKGEAEAKLDKLRKGTQSTQLTREDLVHQYCPNGIYIRSHHSLHLADKEYPGLKDRRIGKRFIRHHNFLWTSNLPGPGIQLSLVKSKSSSPVLFIPFNTPSSKNSKQWTGDMLVSSPQMRKYLKKSEEFWKANKSLFNANLVSGDARAPFRLGIHFVRDSRRKYDWVNPVQTVQDLMVEYGWIEDDSTSYFYPAPLKINGEFSSLDKLGGVFIKIMKL